MVSDDQVLSTIRKADLLGVLDVVGVELAQLLVKYVVDAHLIDVGNRRVVSAWMKARREEGPLIGQADHEFLGVLTQIFENFETRTRPRWSWLDLATDVLIRSISMRDTTEHAPWEGTNNGHPTMILTGMTHGD